MTKPNKLTSDSISIRPITTSSNSRIWEINGKKYSVTVIRTATLSDGTREILQPKAEQDWNKIKPLVQALGLPQTGETLRYDVTHDQKTISNVTKTEIIGAGQPKSETLRITNKIQTAYAKTLSAHFVSKSESIPSTKPEHLSSSSETEALSESDSSDIEASPGTGWDATNEDIRDEDLVAGLELINRKIAGVERINGKAVQRQFHLVKPSKSHIYEFGVENPPGEGHNLHETHLSSLKLSPDDPLIVIPLHVSGHYTGLIIDRERKKVIYYDSKGNKLKSRPYRDTDIHAFCKKNKLLKQDGYSLEEHHSFLQGHRVDQPKGDNIHCGAHFVRFVEQYCGSNPEKDSSSSKTQRDIVEYRREMASALQADVSAASSSVPPVMPKEDPSVQNRRELEEIKELMKQIGNRSSQPLRIPQWLEPKWREFNKPGVTSTQQLQFLTKIRTDLEKKFNELNPAYALARSSAKTRIPFLPNDPWTPLLLNFFKKPQSVDNETIEEIKERGERNSLDLVATDIDRSGPINGIAFSGIGTMEMLRTVFPTGTSEFLSFFQQNFIGLLVEEINSEIDKDRKLQGNIIAQANSEDGIEFRAIFTNKDNYEIQGESLCRLTHTEGELLTSKQTFYLTVRIEKKDGVFTGTYSVSETSQLHPSMLTKVSQAVSNGMEGLYQTGAEGIKRLREHARQIHLPHLQKRAESTTATPDPLSSLSIDREKEADDLSALLDELDEEDYNSSIPNDPNDSGFEDE